MEGEGKCIEEPRFGDVNHVEGLREGHWPEICCEEYEGGEVVELIRV